MLDLESLWSNRKPDVSVFGLTSAMFQGFRFLNVFLWSLASVAEFRSISVWWNVILARPSCGIHDWLRLE